MAVFLKRDRFPAEKVLPYIPVAGLVTTGVQYINTGIIGNQDTRVIVECKANSLSSTGSAIFGARKASASYAFGPFLFPSSAFYNYYNSKSTKDFSSSYERIRVDANKNVCTFTGSTETTISLTYNTFETPDTILLMNTHQGSTVMATKTAWQGEYYLTKIYQNDVLVRDYITVKMKDSEELGMWDLVEDKFYGNEGTGSFTEVSV